MTDYLRGEWGTTRPVVVIDQAYPKPLQPTPRQSKPKTEPTKFSSLLILALAVLLLKTAKDLERE